MDGWVLIFLYSLVFIVVGKYVFHSDLISSFFIGWTGFIVFGYIYFIIFMTLGDNQRASKTIIPT